MLQTDILSDEALLTLVIGRIAAPRLRRAGGLRALLRCDRQRLRDHYAMSSEKIDKLKAIQELARRYASETLTGGEALNCPSDSHRYISARLRDLPHEIFCCLYLDNQHRV
ncbi:MAG: hypothetical protein AAAFM81_13685, partial [Pseudomonadota bacterium]